MIRIIKRVFLLVVNPMHLCISPLNPCLQMHSNHPMLFKQMTFSLLHLWVFVGHPLMSKI